MPTSLGLAVAISVGAAIGVLIDPSLLPTARWLAAVFGLAAFLAGARGLTSIAKGCSAAAIGALCIIAGGSAHERAMHPPLRQLLDDRYGGMAIDTVSTERIDTPLEIEGRLLADASATDSGVNLRVGIERIGLDACLEPAAGAVSITVAGALGVGAMQEWRAGRTIRASATLRRPARYLNEGVPDHERLLARRGIALVGGVKSAALVRVVARGSWLEEAAASTRAFVRRAITAHVGPHAPQSAAIAIAILVGDRSGLDPLIEQRLQEAGTYHVIAISGGNIAILAGLVLGALWVVAIRGAWAAGGAIVLLAAYAFVAGGGASVLRATVMASIYLALRVIDQRTAPLHAIALTVAAILLFSPLAIADVGLWLTFGATAALVIMARTVTLPGSRWVRPVAALIAASVAAELVLLPIGAYVFQRVTVAGLLVNLVAIPCMAVVQIAAMAVAALHGTGLAAAAGGAGWITHLGVQGLLDSSRLVDLVPQLTWRVPSPLIAVVVCYYLALLVAWRARRKVLPAGFAAALLVWIAAAPQTWGRLGGDGRLHVTMLDVGQGDSVLVTFPNGRTLLVDTGGVSLTGEFDIGDRVLGPALRARGLSRLDYLAITHGDPDHIGGALSVVRDFGPAEIWYGTFVNNHQPTMAVHAIAAARRSTWRWLQSGDAIEIGGVELRVHHPAPPDWQRQRVRNDDSLVFEIRYGQVSMFLTGDIGKAVEQDLVARIDALPIVVLKSPHHGSATSSSQAFIEKLRPRMVLISNGRVNAYGHPVPAVLERYRAVGAQILRTDLSGQIELVTDGWSLRSTTYVR